MPQLNGLPVSGYRPQSEAAVDAVNLNKQLEERVLRQLDALVRQNDEKGPDHLSVDARWLSIAKSHIEQGFMAMNRAVFQPARISLPEDEARS